MGINYLKQLFLDKCNIDSFPLFIELLLQTRETKRKDKITHLC